MLLSVLVPSWQKSEIRKKLCRYGVNLFANQTGIKNNHPLPLLQKEGILLISITNLYVNAYASTPSFKNIKEGEGYKVALTLNIWQIHRL